MQKVFYTWWGVIIMVVHISVILTEAKQDTAKSLYRNEIRRNILKLHPFLKEFKLSEEMQSLYQVPIHVLKREIRKRKYCCMKNTKKENAILSPTKLLEPKTILVKTLNIYPRSVESNENPTIPLKYTDTADGSLKGFIQDNKLVFPLSLLQKTNYETSTEATTKDESLQKVKNAIKNVKELQDKSNREKALRESIINYWIKLNSKSRQIPMMRVTSTTAQPTLSVDERNALLDEMESILNNSHCASSQKDPSTREGFPCNIFGSWISEASGKQIDIENDGNLLEFTVTDRIPESDLRKGFMSTGSWTLHGNLLFKNSDVIALTAVDKRSRKVASFIGQCRVCNHKEIVTGEWLLKHLARDCLDVEASQQVLGDIWRKNTIATLEKLRKLSKL